MLPDWPGVVPDGKKLTGLIRLDADFKGAGGVCQSRRAEMH